MAHFLRQIFGFYDMAAISQLAYAAWKREQTTTHNNKYLNKQFLLNIAVELYS